MLIAVQCRVKTTMLSSFLLWFPLTVTLGVAIDGDLSVVVVVVVVVQKQEATQVQTKNVKCQHKPFMTDFMSLLASI